MPHLGETVPTEPGQKVKSSMGQSQVSFIHLRVNKTQLKTPKYSFCCKVLAGCVVLPQTELFCPGLYWPPGAEGHFWPPLQQHVPLCSDASAPQCAAPLHTGPGYL